MGADLSDLGGRHHRTKPQEWWGEGVETGWRASHVDEGTVRLSSKGESDRITQRSAVQIRPPQPTSNCKDAVAFACLLKVQSSVNPPTNTSDPDSVFDKVVREVIRPSRCAATGEGVNVLWLGFAPRTTLRMLPCHAEGRGFKFRRFRQYLASLLTLLGACELLHNQTVFSRFRVVRAHPYRVLRTGGRANS